MLSIIPTVNGALFVFLALNIDLSYSESKIGKLLFVCTSLQPQGLQQVCGPSPGSARAAIEGRASV